MSKRDGWLETPVEVRITFPTSNMHGLSAQISLIDRMSGKSLATVDLTSAQFTELLASRNIITMAELLPHEHYASVGKDYVTERVENIPDEFKSFRPSWNKERTRLEGATSQMKSWAEAYAYENDWEGYVWSHHNYGWSLRVYRYVDTTLEERKAVVEGYGYV